MNPWQKIVVGAASVLALGAMDLLKIQDPQLHYALLGVLGLLVSGHVAVNLPTIAVGK